MNKETRDISMPKKHRDIFNWRRVLGDCQGFLRALRRLRRAIYFIAYMEDLAIEDIVHSATEIIVSYSWVFDFVSF